MVREYILYQLEKVYPFVSLGNCENLKIENILGCHYNVFAASLIFLNSLPKPINLGQLFGPKNSVKSGNFWSVHFSSRHRHRHSFAIEVIGA